MIFNYNKKIHFRSQLISIHKSRITDLNPNCGIGKGGIYRKCKISQKKSFFLVKCYDKNKRFKELIYNTVENYRNIQLAAELLKIIGNKHRGF